VDVAHGVLGVLPADPPNSLNVREWLLRLLARRFSGGARRYRKRGFPTAIAQRAAHNLRWLRGLWLLQGPGTKAWKELEIRLPVHPLGSSNSV